MNNFRRVAALGGVSFRKWGGNWRVRVIILLVVLLVFNFTRGIRDVCDNSGIPVSPWAVIAVMSTFDSAIIILMGYILLYCDAPFFDEEYPYLILRSGRSCFISAQIFYIAVSSFLYTLFVWFVTLLCCLPNLSFSLKWGKILNTVAIQKTVPMLQMKSTVLDIPPLKAIGIQILLLWAVGCFIGLLIFFLNLRFSRIAGISTATVLVFTNMFADYYVATHQQNSGFIYHFLPAAWGNIGNIHTVGDSCPSFAYIILSLVAINFILIIAIFKVSKNREVEVLPKI